VAHFQAQFLLRENYLRINPKLGLAMELDDVGHLSDLRRLSDILKSPSFCSRSQAESPHIFCVLPLSDEFRERIGFCGSHEKFRKCLAQRICNEAQHGLDELDRLTEQWVADHLQRGKTSKKRQRTRHS